MCAEENGGTGYLARQWLRAMEISLVLGNGTEGKTTG
jgi:hypothetical protein